MLIEQDEMLCPTHRSLIAMSGRLVEASSENPLIAKGAMNGAQPGRLRLRSGVDEWATCQQLFLMVRA